MKSARIVVWLASSTAACVACSDAFDGFQRAGTRSASEDREAGSRVSDRGDQDAATGVPSQEDPPRDAQAATDPHATDSSASSGSTCMPQSCSALHAECGAISDGCNGTLDCGGCSLPMMCGGGGLRNRCGCTAQTCTSLNAECGTISDGCGSVVDCGTCAAPNSCGVATPNRCSCTPTTCAAEQAECGVISDGCNGTLSCGSCGLGALCGLSVPNRCGVLPCVPTTCSDIGATCGPLMDDCGGNVDCGKCDKDYQCVEHQCVCKPGKTCNSGPGGGTDDDD
ncbi:MAG TPA: hypothetical protein VHO25_07655 [Polyangiaceae bacterium]|nr:hypothetical protein [Polyangiaceae bacterium]